MYRIHIYLQNEGRWSSSDGSSALSAAVSSIWSIFFEYSSEASCQRNHEVLCSQIASIWLSSDLLPWRCVHHSKWISCPSLAIPFLAILYAIWNLWYLGMVDFWWYKTVLGTLLDNYQEWKLSPGSGDKSPQLLQASNCVDALLSNTWLKSSVQFLLAEFKR